MDKTNRILIKQAILIPVFALYNIFIGLFLSGYSVVTQRISELALESWFYAYTHRLADILIGVSMCLFAIGCYRKSNATYTFISMFLFGITWIFAGIFILGNPLHDIYGLTTVLLLVPVLFAFEMGTHLMSPKFKHVSILVTFIHVIFFWFFSYGYMPFEYKGATQRIWVFVTLMWYGAAAYQLISTANRVRAGI